MNDTVTLALVATSIIIVIGFFGDYLFKRTGLPDMFFLIFLGIILGPLLRVFDPTSVVVLAPYIAALALVFILFDGGIKMNLYQVISESPRATLLSISNFMLSLITIALFTHFVFGIPLLYGVLLGAICGGTSSIVVLSLARRISISEQGATILSLESAITDIVCIVSSLVVIGIIMTGYIDYAMVGKEMAGRFAIGILVGVILGLLWLSALPIVAKQSYAYMLTLAVVLFAYALSEHLGGSGALSSLLFGIVLGNEHDIFRILRRERVTVTVIDEGLRRFESEIAFLIRSFFFVYLGLIVKVTDYTLLVLSIVLTFLLLFARYIAVVLVTYRTSLRKERPIMSLVFTRGLAAAVLSTLPMQYGLPYAEIFVDVTFVIIMSTAIICTVGVPLLSRIRR